MSELDDRTIKKLSNLDSPEYYNGIRERTVLLYHIMKKYIVEFMNFLELGCGYTYLPLFIRNDINKFKYTALDRRVAPIDFLRKYYEMKGMENVKFLRKNMEAFDVKEDYDFIISLGCSARTGVAEGLHEKVLARKKPEYALFETGDARHLKDVKEHRISLYERLIDIYEKNDYVKLEQNNYVIFGDWSYRDRYYTILRRGD